MNIVLRPGTMADANECGRICFDAFTHIAHQHNFPPDFPAPEVAIGFMHYLLSAPGTYSVVADVDGKIAGSNFLFEADPIAGVGPITVDVNQQNGSIGKKLMLDVIRRADENSKAGIRLVQAAYHTRSFSLYAKLGFDIKEPLSVMQGQPLNIQFASHNVRTATENDIAACNELCYQVHGHDRSKELSAAVGAGNAVIVERDGLLTGYTTGLSFFGHTVAVSNTDLKALIGAAKEFAGPGFLLPSRNTEVLRWCLENGLRVVQPFTLMARGMYNEPRGAFVPSILF